MYINGIVCARDFVNNCRGLFGLNGRLDFRANFQSNLADWLSHSCFQDLLKTTGFILKSTISRWFWEVPYFETRSYVPGSINSFYLLVMVIPPSMTGHVCFFGTLLEKLCYASGFTTSVSHVRNRCNFPLNPGWLTGIQLVTILI